MEGIYDKLERVSARVLTRDINDQAAGDALSAIAREEDLNSRIRRNVMDTRRALSFMMRSRMLNAEQFEEATWRGHPTTTLRIGRRRRG